MSAALHLIAEAQLDPDKQCNKDQYAEILGAIAREQVHQLRLDDYRFVVNLIEHYQD